MRKPHWLDGVARVLRADTDDLRELARIGGVDPHTAYVGTRLDGADLRGQDLRGMVFTDLDLSRVKHDAGTRIDPDQVLGVATPEGPLMLVLSSRLDLANAKRRLGALSPRLFGPDEAFSFFDGVRVGYPAIVLAFETEMAIAEDLLSSMGKDGLPWALVVQGRDPLRWLSRWSDQISERHAFFTQEFGLARVGRAPDIAVETRFLCRLLTENWDELMARQGPPTFFMRAQGVGPRPILDAGAQLFDRLWRMELQLCHLRLAFPPGELETAEMLGLNALFEWDPQFVRSSPSAVGAFVDLGNAHFPERHIDKYTQQVLTSFQEISSPRHGSRIFVGPSGTRLPVSDVPLSSTEREVAVASPANLKTLAFADVTEILISQRADISSVLEGLTETGELWVNARDVLGVDDEDAVTIWSLLAAQMRRFGSQPLGEARQDYLRLMVHAAIRQSENEVQWLDPLLEQASLIRVEDLVFDLGRTNFTATLTFAGEPATIRLAVKIEPEGPSLTLISAKGVRRP